MELEGDDGVSQRIIRGEHGLSPPGYGGEHPDFPKHGPAGPLRLALALTAYMNGSGVIIPCLVRSSSMAVLLTPITDGGIVELLSLLGSGCT